MSKTKEQCMIIISERLSDIEHYEENIYLNNLKETIKEITDSEYGLLWFYDIENNLVHVEEKTFPLQRSILNTILTSKEGLYENHVKSHKFYNSKIDNPLNINIKSLLILPILDKAKNVLGFISAVNSKSDLGGFGRYDLRLLSLLNNKAQQLIEYGDKKQPLKIKNNDKHVTDSPSKSNETSTVNSSVAQTETKVKKSQMPKRIQRPSKRKTKADLELALKEQEKKIKELASLLLEKETKISELEKRVEYQQLVPVEVVEDEVLLVETEINNHTKIKIILDFLTKEVNYLNKESQSIYLFLEMIKSVLYNKETLAHFEEKLFYSQVMNSLVEDFYTKEQVKVTMKEFKLYTVLVAVANLYSDYFREQNILFNIFIDPSVPSSVASESDLIQSVMTHLLNNVNALVKENGVVELLIFFSEVNNSLEIEIKLIQPEAPKPFKTFFKSKEVSNNVTTGDIGLGLSVSSNLLKILGGKLKLTNKGENEHSFIALIPVEFTDLVSHARFKHKRPTKIGILMNSENSYAYENVYRYLKAFGIDENNIVAVNNYKKLRNIKVVHFICFENMLTDKMNLDGFTDITVLKYSEQPLSIKRSNSVIHELYLNAYYGMELQKILFPDLPIEEIEGNTLLKEDSFLSRVTKKFT